MFDVQCSMFYLSKPTRGTWNTYDICKTITRYKQKIITTTKIIISINNSMKDRFLYNCNFKNHDLSVIALKILGLGSIPQLITN